MKPLVYVLIVGLQLLLTAQQISDPCAGKNQLDFYSVCSDTSSCKIHECNLNEKTISVKDCPTAKPHCVTRGDSTGYCSDKPGESPCSIQKEPFQCQSFGVFPDPYNCKASYSCSKDTTKDPVPQTDCNANEYFNEVSESCVRATPVPCIKVDCQIKMGNGIFSPYGSSNKYYAICAYNNTPSTGELIEAIHMFKCAQGATFDRNPSVSRCIYTCPDIGRYRYSLDDTKYYDCLKKGGQAKVAQCKLGSVFMLKDNTGKGECQYKARKFLV